MSVYHDTDVQGGVGESQVSAVAPRQEAETGWTGQSVPQVSGIFSKYRYLAGGIQIICRN